MEKLQILARKNEDRQFYIKFKSSTRALEILKAMTIELGFDYFDEDFVWSERTLVPYKDSIDSYFPLRNESIAVDIICSERCIHMILRCDDVAKVNKIIDKHARWLKPDTKGQKLAKKAKSL